MVLIQVLTLLLTITICLLHVMMIPKWKYLDILASKKDQKHWLAKDTQVMSRMWSSLNKTTISLQQVAKTTAFSNGKSRKRNENLRLLFWFKIISYSFGLLSITQKITKLLLIFTFWNSLSEILEFMFFSSLN